MRTVAGKRKVRAAAPAIRKEAGFLKAKEARVIAEHIQKQWGADVSRLFADHFLLYTPKEKLYLISRAIEQLDLRALKLSSIGMYFGEYKAGVLRLSIEGSQLVGPLAKKNVVELTATQTEMWIRGLDIAKTVKDVAGYVLIHHGNDWLGCGKYREGEILNFVPKARRLQAIASAIWDEAHGDEL